MEPSVAPVTERAAAAAAGAPADADGFRLAALEVSLATTDLARLEAAIAGVDAPRSRAWFDAHPAVGEVAWLRTCHRLEVYLWARPTADPDAAADALGLPADVRRLHRDAAAVLHLHRVAAGLESMAVGEREVREQVRAAGRRVASRRPRPVLAPLLDGAARAADVAAPDVPRGRSLAAVAATRLLEASPWPFPRVLIVGAGVVGREVAELLASSARITLLYRHRPVGEAFLRETGARQAPWSRFDDELAVSDAVVTAAKATGRLVDAGRLAGRERPLLAVDLGVPRNIDPAVDAIPGVRRLDLEALRPRGRPADPDGLAAAVAEGAERAHAALRREAAEERLDVYRREVETLRRTLLERAAGPLEGLTPAQADAVERLTRSLVGALVDGPTRRLRAGPGPGAPERLEELLALLRPRGPSP